MIQRQRYLYVILAENKGIAKIGATKHLNDRLGEIRRQAGDNVRYVGIVCGSFDDEKDLQRRFASSCIGREWFTWTPELANHVLWHMDKPVRLTAGGQELGEGKLPWLARISDSPKFGGSPPVRRKPWRNPAVRNGRRYTSVIEFENVEGYWHGATARPPQTARVERWDAVRSV